MKTNNKKKYTGDCAGCSELGYCDFDAFECPAGCDEARNDPILTIEQYERERDETDLSCRRIRH